MTHQRARLAADPVAEYFGRFLPERIGTMGLDTIESFTTTFAFVITDIPDGTWICRFDRGHLAGVRRWPDADEAAFAFRMDSDAFWDVVGGQIDPREVFLSGRADISGDAERALMVGMILAQFTRRNPYERPAPRSKSTHG